MRLPWMPRTERRMWAEARTFAELGQLMARWLEGEITSRPGYQPRYGPEGETRVLVPVLAGACRAGVLTTNSQPGAKGDGWRQRAAVDGFVTDPLLLRRLVEAAEQAGLYVIVNDLLSRPGAGAVPVTTCGQDVRTAFGGALGIRDLQLIWGGCSRQALAAVADGTQVTLIDPEWGPTTRLWHVLARVTTSTPSSRVR